MPLQFNVYVPHNAQSSFGLKAARAASIVLGGTFLLLVVAFGPLRSAVTPAVLEEQRSGNDLLFKCQLVRILGRF